MRLLASVVLVGAFALPSAGANVGALPGLVYTPGYGNSMIARTDPVTLARSGPSVRLGGNASSWAYSPSGRYVAVASYPQRLTVLEAASLRVVSRTRLAPGGGVAHAVTWARRDRVLAVIETPGGAVVAAVDPLRGAVVRRNRVPWPYGHTFERLRRGVVFLLGSHGRVAPARIAVADEEAAIRVVTVPEVVVGAGLHANALETQSPGLAVDPVGERAYLVAGDAFFTVALDTLEVTRHGPFRTMAKSRGRATRSARWLGSGRLAVSGADFTRDGSTPFGLRLIDVRTGRATVVDPGASSFTAAAGVLLVEERLGRRALRATAYGRDGAVRWRRDLPWTTWMKKEGTFGYACRDAMLRAIVDLRTGAAIRHAASGRCPTLLIGHSRG